MAQPDQPEKVYFEDDGSIPNSALPLLVYRQAFTFGSSDLAGTIEEHFARKTTGPDHGVRVCFPFITITAQRMKCWRFIEAQRHCNSAAKKAGSLP